MGHLPRPQRVASRTNNWYVRQHSPRAKTATTATANWPPPSPPTATQAIEVFDPNPAHCHAHGVAVADGQPYPIGHANAVSHADAIGHTNTYAAPTPHERTDLLPNGGFEADGTWHFPVTDARGRRVDTVAHSGA